MRLVARQPKFWASSAGQLQPYCNSADYNFSFNWLGPEVSSYSTREADVFRSLQHIYSEKFPSLRDPRKTTYSSQCRSGMGREDHEHHLGAFLLRSVYLDTPSPPPSSGIQLWVLMLQEATSSLQCYWAKGRMRHERSMQVNPGRTWETLSKKHWITESFKIKVWEWPSPRSRHSSHTLHASRWAVTSRHSRTTSVCTSHRHTCNLDHVSPTHQLQL